MDARIVVTTTAGKYEDSFGFTEEEVFAALDEFGLSDRQEEVKRWYDGFIFGNRSDIYNPWSIINYLDKGKVAPYWVNTSANSLAGKLIREGSPEIKITMENLLYGGHFQTVMDEQVVFSQLDQGLVRRLSPDKQCVSSSHDLRRPGKHE